MHNPLRTGIQEGLAPHQSYDEHDQNADEYHYKGDIVLPTSLRVAFDIEYGMGYEEGNGRIEEYVDDCSRIITLGTKTSYHLQHIM